MRYLFALLIISFNSIYISQAQKYRMYVGTYTDAGSEGIYAYEFDAATGKTKAIDTARGQLNPSYLTVSPDKKFLYAVNENGGKDPGMISAFAIEPQSGKLRFLNSKSSEGDYPCYITVSPNRKWVIAANYGGGNLIAYAIEADGSLSSNKQSIQHSGKGFNPDRQESPHVHSTIFTPAADLLLVCDLGLDKIFRYRFNEKAASNPLQAATLPFVTVADGHGPRHLSFHPVKKIFYLMEELSGMVSAWNYNAKSTKSFQSIDAHPADYKGARGSADIHVSPDGKQVYASNRYAANNIAIFTIDPKTGMLSQPQFQALTGKVPRNFIIEPSGKFVLVAGQDSNDIEVFRRDAATGTLTKTANTINVSKPVCIQLVKM